MNAGESDRWPADRTGSSGRGANAGLVPQVPHTGPLEVELEEVLAWGSGDDSVVTRKTWSSDLTLRLATSVAVAAVVALAALGAANHTPSPASDTDRAHPVATDHATPGPTNPNRPPSCLVDWPNHQHVPCPMSLPKVLESEPDCCRLDRVFLRR